MIEILNLKRDKAINRHLKCALYEERKKFLEYLRTLGMKRTILHAYATLMASFVEISAISTPRLITCQELNDVVDRYMEINPNVKFKKEKRSLFIYRISKWLSYSGLLEQTNNPIYEQDKLEKYCSYLLEIRGFSPKTIELRYRNLSFFLTYCEQQNQDLATISASFIDRYIKDRSYKETRRTRNQTMANIRGFIRYCAENGWCSNGIALAIKGARLYDQEELPSYLAWEHVVNIIQQLSKREDATGLRDYAICLMLAVYGLRDSEVVNLKLSDIDWDNDIITIQRAKSFRYQKLPLVESVGNAILAYITKGRQNESNCPNVFLRRRAPVMKLRSTGTLVRHYLKEEGVDIKHFGPHSLRHSCATFLINHGSSYKLVSDILGHQSYDTVTIYAKVDFRNLKKVSDMKWEEYV